MFDGASIPHWAPIFRDCVTQRGRKRKRGRCNLQRPPEKQIFLLAQHLFCSLADGGSVQTIQLEQIPGRAGAAELILHAHTADGGGALLAQDGTDSLAQTADDTVLLGSDDLAALLGRLEDDVLIQGLNGVDVDDPGVDALGSQLLVATMAMSSPSVICSPLPSSKW